MELIAYWLAGSCSTTQEIRSVLWNNNIHYRIHKNNSVVPILSHTNQIHILDPYFFDIHFNIILPSTSRFSLLFFLKGFLAKSKMNRKESFWEIIMGQYEQNQ
jgi:hypothetical protein